MKPAVLLIDLQNDFLISPSLEPSAGKVVEQTTKLLHACRTLSIPVIHVWTTVNPEDDQRMPHWKGMGKWSCVEGTVGHTPPEPLSPLESEKIIYKTFFSAFSNNDLDQTLQSLEIDTLLLAGVHLHGCIRATALDAYQRGFRVLVAEDAIASDDPLHAAITRRYMEKRAIRFIAAEDFLSLTGQDKSHPDGNVDVLPNLPYAIIDNMEMHNSVLEQIVHISPRQNDKRLWKVPICNEEQVAQAAASAKDAWYQWKVSKPALRIQIMENLASLLEKELKILAEQMAIEIGKPRIQGEAEVTRSVELLRTAIRYASRSLEADCSKDSVRRYRPLGAVAIISPWNNPLAIPIGKIAPAFLFGNTVIWKPAPKGSSLAVRIMGLLNLAGCPPGVVNLICGDRSTAMSLMSDSNVDAVTFSGALAAGYSAQDVCASRHIPLQAELGGNNASIVWADCDLEETALKVAEAAFGFAGQRCTANRRVIVGAGCYDEFLKYLEKSVSSLVWNDPLERRTQVGPLISAEKCKQVASVIERAKTSAALVFAPHRSDPNYAELTRKGAYFPPTVICCNDSKHEIVREETFGPVLVVQKADDFKQAINLCNGVKQGLVAALFSHSKDLQSEFLEHTQAGVLKINTATADANAEAPFGGWKASGIGPPEHGASDREFYTRTQAVYNSSQNKNV